METLAAGVVRALTGADDAFCLVDQVWPAVGPPDRKPGLAALRVLGPDALTPFMLAGHRFGPDDAEVVLTSIRTFPIPEPDSGSEDDDTTVRQLRDWATGQVMTRLGVPDCTRPYPALARGALGRDRGWVGWTGVLAQLSPLVLPWLDCPLHADAQGNRLDIARGVTRAVLRRDHLTAARLARWLAAGGPVLMDPPFPLEPVLRQLELVAEPDPRLQLEIALARHGLEASNP